MYTIKINNTAQRTFAQQHKCIRFQSVSVLVSFSLKMHHCVSAVRLGMDSVLVTENAEVANQMRFRASWEPARGSSILIIGDPAHNGRLRCPITKKMVRYINRGDAFVFCVSLWPTLCQSIASLYTSTIWKIYRYIIPLAPPEDFYFKPAHRLILLWCAHFLNPVSIFALGF